MGATGFGGQVNAVWRKNWSIQRRACASNCCLLSCPIVLVGLLGILQLLINNALLTGEDLECGCKCTECCPEAGKVYPNGTFPDGQCRSIDFGTCPGNCVKRDKTKCGFEYSMQRQTNWCPIPNPDLQPAILQLPNLETRAKPAKPGATFLYTANTDAMAKTLAGKLFEVPKPAAMVAAMETEQQKGFEVMGPTKRGLSEAALRLLTELGVSLGTSTENTVNLYVENAFMVEEGLEALLPATFCKELKVDRAAGRTNESLTLGEFIMLSATYHKEPLNETQTLYVGGLIQQLGLGFLTFGCTDAYRVQEVSVSEMNQKLYCGWRDARCGGVLDDNEYAPAYDFGRTSNGTFDLTMFYNITGNNGDEAPTTTRRLPQQLNLAVNAWMRWLLGDDYRAVLIGVGSMPKGSSKLELDFSSLLGPLFYTWVVQMLLPTYLVQLVYEKEKRLRMMMKMHGLGDRSYWFVTYLWFMLLYILYIIVYLVFGSIIQLKIFIENSYGVQIVFYLLFGNVMIAFAFLLSCFFDNSRTATVVAFLYVFGSGLIGNLLIEQFFERNYSWVFFVEWIPAFGLYRGLWELGQYAFIAGYRNTQGMNFGNLGDANNGMGVVWAIFVVEWIVFMVLAWYLEQVYASGTGIRRHPLFFLDCFRSKGSTTQQSEEPRDELVGKMMTELQDVAIERQRVMTINNYEENPIVIRDLRKVYPSQDGRPPKLAVRSMSLAVEKGECFGLLGPNGAGKSTAINMMVGFLTPSSGTALINGMDIRRDMQSVYGIMGVCPQHDLLWETLTGREHLLFYGRLKGLKGPDLQTAVDAALSGVNLYFNNVGNKMTKQYSGGMKRRLSVAVSFMGSPTVVYLDEPSTGLDPASRRNLWDVVKVSKSNRAIILTTHSMEEAEVLCDRLGIFVDGQLVCIGNPKELTSRYGGYYVFTLMVPPDDERKAQDLVTRMCPNARLTYHVAGTFKYELPSSDLPLSKIFATMADSRRYMTVLDWGVANATLEEVFIKFARQIGARAAELEGESKRGDKSFGERVANALRSCCGQKQPLAPATVNVRSNSGSSTAEAVASPEAWKART